VKRKEGGTRTEPRRGILIALSLCLLASCATKPEPAKLTETEEPEPAAAAPAEPTPQERETLLWEEVRKSIAKGYPSSLRSAYREISESPFIRTPEGVELAYVSFRLYETLYPLSLDFTNPYEPPQGNILSLLFAEALAGEYPSVAGKDVSFITLIVSTLACLRSSDQEIFDLCEEGLSNLEILVPDSVFPPLLRGTMAEKQGRSKEAFDFYAKALSLAPDCYPATIGIGRLLLSSGRYGAVLETLDPVVKEYGGNGELYTLQCEAYLGIGNLREASLYAERALALTPDSLHLLVLRARILEAQGNNEQAKKLVTAAERQSWREPGLFLVKAKLLVKDGYIDEALEILSRGSAAFPEDITLKEARGLLLLQSGRAMEGTALLEATISRNPSRIQALIILIDAAIAESRWTDAASLLSRALAVEENAELWRRAALVASQAGNHELALAYGEKLRKAKPESAEAWIPSIRALIALKRLPEAGALIAEGFSRVKTAGMRSQFYYLESLAAQDDERKIESLRKALLEDLQNLEALMEIARIYRSRGDYRQAYRYLKQAAAIAPLNPQIAAGLAELEALLK
jgi:tetratricopeptide (TPR) repeat protein